MKWIKMRMYNNLAGYLSNVKSPWTICYLPSGKFFLIQVQPYPVDFLTKLFRMMLGSHPFSNPFFILLAEIKTLSACFEGLSIILQWRYLVYFIIYRRMIGE